MLLRAIPGILEPRIELDATVERFQIMLGQILLKVGVAHPLAVSRRLVFLLSVYRDRGRQRASVSVCERLLGALIPRRNT